MMLTFRSGVFLTLSERNLSASRDLHHPHRFRPHSETDARRPIVHGGICADGGEINSRWNKSRQGWEYD